MGIIKSSLYIPFLLLLFFTFNISLSCGADDTITTTKSLTGDQTLVSSGGKFELGFFSTGNSFNYYIGMWYKKDPLQTILWVANRYTPVPDKFSSQLKILDGYLVLLNGSRSIIWSNDWYNDWYISSNSTLAVLRDDGNLVLIDGSKSNGSDSMPIWESFNHPTHTLLPGAKLRYNKLTAKRQILTSWINSEDPGFGIFDLELDSDRRLYIRSNTELGDCRYSGAWNLEISNSMYNFSYIDNEIEIYFTYSPYNTSIMSRFVLDISGKIEMFIWFETSLKWYSFGTPLRRICEFYGYCGAFGVCYENLCPICKCLTGFMPSPGIPIDYSRGCVRKINLECGKKDGFVTISHMGLPGSPQFVAVGSVVECEANCLYNCSCTAYAYYDNGCSIWNDVLMNLKQLNVDDVNGKVIHVKVSSSEFSRTKSGVSRAKSGVVHVIVLGCVGGVLALLGLVWVVMMRRRMKLDRPTHGSLLVFGYKDLKRATKNFSQKLGGGGFGSVFKGTLCDSNVIAVKRLEGLNQGEKEFRAEVSTIGTIQHVNLVKLHGFCPEANKKLLVYEYMPNGSLHSHLFSAKDSKVLDWKKRYQIALGTARGLAYLHENCRDIIIHCDIKPENILLDAEFCPKVADFGLAKIFGREFSRVLTTMRGTRGYLAPEWISGVAITAKADVYSYGMMLFELVSGKRNWALSLDSKVTFFPTEAASVTIKEGDLLSLLDHRLDNIADREEVTRICRVACWCVQDEENLRPSMGQVVQILEGVLEVKLPQMPLSLQLHAVNHEENIILFEEPLLSLDSDALVLPLNTLH